MEPSTIQQLSEQTIIDSSYEELEEWLNSVAANTSIPLNGVLSIVNSIKQNKFVLIPSFVLDFILAFFKQNYSSIDWQLIDSSVARVFISQPFNVLLWSFNDVYHCACIDDAQKDMITTTLTAFDGGVETEYMQSLNLESLKDTVPSLNVRAMLVFMGLLEGDIEVVPLTSATLGINEGTARFSDAIWFNEIQKKTIMVAGCGGIGSYVVFLLSRMQPQRLFIYDDDVVEMVNMSGQLYSIKDLKKYKVDAISSMIRDYSIYNNVIAVRERFTQETEPVDIMICGFDNMEARKVFFNRWKAHICFKSEEDKKHCLFIDGRLAAEEFQVFCIRGDDTYSITKYESDFLFSDEEADTTQCSYKQTTYMANMIGSIMVNLFTNFVANEIVEGLRDLPFFTSYSADSMMFKTTY